MRINRYLASCGIASRRGSEQLVRDGLVKCNGRPVETLAFDVGVRDVVTVNGEEVRPAEDKIYLMLNKPKGCVCTASDDRGRKTVYDYLDLEAGHRVFPVGRLDYDSEGLLLFTNDGDFANRLTHPSAGIEKTYLARIEGEIDPDKLETLRRGVMLDGVRTRPAKVKLIGTADGESRVEVIISEGRNRQVRRMFEAVGKNVVFLKRTAVGPLKLGGLGRGACRPLTEREISYFLVREDGAKKRKTGR